MQRLRSKAPFCVQAGMIQIRINQIVMESRMNSRTLFTALMIVGTASIARAQQAAIPTPPKTVNPTPQTPTDCRGCTDSSNDKKTSVGKYDEKKSLERSGRREAGREAGEEGGGQEDTSQEDGDKEARREKTHHHEYGQSDEAHAEAEGEPRCPRSDATEERSDEEGQHREVGPSPIFSP